MSNTRRAIHKALLRVFDTAHTNKTLINTSFFRMKEYPLQKDSIRARRVWESHGGPGKVSVGVPCPAPCNLMGLSEYIPLNGAAGIRLVPISRPLPHTTCHVHDSIRARTFREAPYGDRPFPFRFPCVCLIHIKGISPRIYPSISPSCRLLPFCFCWKPFACPPAVNICIEPVNMGYGEVVLSLRIFIFFLIKLH